MAMRLPVRGPSQNKIAGPHQARQIDEDIGPPRIFFQFIATFQEVESIGSSLEGYS
jgi:hypothetical protein